MNTNNTEHTVNMQAVIDDLTMRIAILTREVAMLTSALQEATKVTPESETP